MLRYLSPFKFSSFYHSHNFTVSPEHLQLQTCKLAAYVGAYRKYGHYYASLDPLSLYNK
jgi:2-oxoglutarate dehydrogenase complex dehydrogenase (E1) component-like enzyme